MLYTLTIALLLACVSSQTTDRVEILASENGTLQVNTETDSNYIVQLFQGLLPLPFALNTCTKVNLLGDSTYSKYVCDDEGTTVTRTVYTDADCTTMQSSTVITNETVLGTTPPFNMQYTPFYCGGDDNVVMIDLSTDEDCSNPVPVAAAIQPCLTTRLSTESPVINFRLFCSDEDDMDVAQLQVFTYTPVAADQCATDSWEYSIQIDDNCGALFPFSGAYVYGDVTGCSQSGAYVDSDDDDSASSVSYMVAVVVAVVAAMFH